MGVKKGESTAFTEVDDIIIRDKWDELSVGEIADLIHMTRSSVMYHAKALGLEPNKKHYPKHIHGK